MTLKRKLFLISALTFMFVVLQSERAQGFLGFCTYASQYGDCSSGGMESDVLAATCNYEWCHALSDICVDWCIEFGLYQASQYCQDNYPEFTDCEFWCICYW